MDTHWTIHHADATKRWVSCADAVIGGRKIRVQPVTGPEARFGFWNATADGEPLAIGAVSYPYAAMAAAERAASALPVLTAADVTVFDALDRLPPARLEQVLESLRTQAVDEGCRWSELEGQGVEAIQRVAGWDDDDLADILGADVCPTLFSEAGYPDEEG